jgi:hypothetical protein
MTSRVLVFIQDPNSPTLITFYSQENWRYAKVHHDEQLDSEQTFKSIIQISPSTELASHYDQLHKQALTKKQEKQST